MANEILEATREVCKSIIIDSKKSLEKARRVESEAESKLAESQRDQQQSQALKIEAESLYEDAQLRAEELVNQSRALAERESMEIKERATMEAQRMMVQAEAIRGAAKEEMEAQRIYVETARLKVEAQGVLANLQEELARPEELHVAETNGHAPRSDITEEWPELGQAEPVSSLVATSVEPSSEIETQIPDEDKKGSRGSGSSGSRS